MTEPGDRRALIALGLLASGGRVLLVQESYGLRLWGLPGGRVEAGEPILDAVCREVYEETGLDARVTALVCVRERADQVVLVFDLTPASTKARTRDPDEIVDLRWFDAADLTSGQYDVDDLSRRVLRRWFDGRLTRLSAQRWTGRDGRTANLFA